MRVSGNSRRNWQPARACWQGPNHHAPNRGRNRVDHRTITERSRATSVHSKPVFVCSDCTFLDEIHRAALDKKRSASRRGSNDEQPIKPQNECAAAPSHSAAAATKLGGVDSSGTVGVPEFRGQNGIAPSRHGRPSGALTLSEKSCWTDAVHRAPTALTQG